MAWFDFFKKKKSRSKRSVKTVRSNKGYFCSEILLEKFHAELQTMHLLLQNHEQTLKEHSQSISAQAQKLEELVDLTASNRSFSRSQVSPIEPVQKQSLQPANVIKPDKLGIDSLSKQERNILTVFFQHPDMALSYADIGKFLNKSPNTIKNQIRQLGMKADLFTKTADSENRNRLRLKENLRMEQYLKLTDQSSD